MPHAVSSGTRIWWEEKGQGQPLLLVMGFGHSSALWGPFADRLAESFRVLLVDNRGTGRSAAPPGPYTVPQMAEDVVAVLDEAGVERAHLLGFSLGSVVAHEIAISHPERVDRLVLGSSQAPGEGTVLGSRAGLTWVLLKPLLPEALARRVVSRYMYAPTTPPYRLREALARLRAAEAPFSTGLRQSRGALGYESASRIGAITAPTLVLHGELDRLSPFPNAVRVRDAIPGARLVSFPQAAHSLMADEPEGTLAAVTDFLLG